MLEQDIALVTGASRGIGQAIALALAAAGARVVGTATTAQGAAAISTTLASHGYNGRGAVLDVASEASCESLLAAMGAAEGMPTILVNNAAITRDTLLLRMKPEDWDQVITTNLTAVFRLSKACLRRMMKERRGRIINITSVVGFTGNPGQANYAAAKAGLLGFTRSLANRGAACGPCRADPDGAARARRGRGRGGSISRLPAGRLHHGRDVARERRLVHGLAVGAERRWIIATAGRPSGSPCHGHGELSPGKTNTSPLPGKVAPGGVFPYNTAPCAAAPARMRIPFTVRRTTP